MRILALLMVASLVVSSPAPGVIGTIDVAPAATLLYPYFEVDPADPNGVTTLLAVSNSSATATTVHFTLWTDLGVPTETFNVYLTGYDVQTINLRDLLVQGLAPRTASDGQDPADTISPQGPISQDINFASCSNENDPDEFDPYGDDGPAPGTGLPPDVPWLGDVRVAELQRAHAGAPTTTGYWAPAGRCIGTVRGDGLLRGYVTADTVNQCTPQLPSQLGYHSTVVTFQNVLFGDFLIVDPAQNFAEGDVAVHIEASQSDPLTAPPNPTFYGGLVADGVLSRREALPTRFAVPWGNGSDLVSWRSAEQAPPTTGWACGGAFAPFPLGVAGVTVFDSEENHLGYTPALSFSFAAQRDLVNEAGFPGTGNGKAGWMLVDLNTPAPTGAFGTTHQGWLLHRFRPEPPGGQGRFSSTTRAIQLDNAAVPYVAPAGTPATGGGAR